MQSFITPNFRCAAAISSRSQTGLGDLGRSAVAGLASVSERPNPAMRGIKLAAPKPPLCVHSSVASYTAQISETYGTRPALPSWKRPDARQFFTYSRAVMPRKLGPIDILRAISKAQPLLKDTAAVRER